MRQNVLVGFGAGAASALLFMSVASGSILSLLLFYMAPLPILISALGWSHLAGLVAGLTAAASIGALLGIHYFLSFLIGIALPAWWLGYLSMLARPVGSNGSPNLEWYPVGRLLLWVAFIGVLLTILAIPGLGTDKEGVQTALREIFERALRTQAPANVSTAEIEPWIGRLVAVVLPAAAASIVLVNIANLWLAGRIVSISGRLRRPWPDLSALTLPRTAMALLAIAFFGSFLPDLPGMLADIAAAGMITVYAVVGFAILHTITRGTTFRTYLLIAAYSTVVLSALILFRLPILAIALLGLADTAFNIRARMVQKHGPPTLPT
jgi:hypothetical protein